jgi:2-amino-4-hydroxy-6-hydroxymethyldihydropteridine diphosphokinase
MTDPVCVTAYIGLGSNLEEPRAQLERALDALTRLQQSELLEHSAFYRSAPMGPADQPDYVNAVAALHTALAPLELLDALQAIERAQGRQRGPQRWGPRTLDLDILLYGGRTIDSPRLTIPHPGLAERNFVLVPLFEIAPELVLPDGRTLAALVAACPGDGLVRLDR